MKIEPYREAPAFKDKGKRPKISLEHCSGIKPAYYSRKKEDCKNKVKLQTQDTKIIRQPSRKQRSV
jgi:hypothetical protein